MRVLIDSNVLFSAAYSKGSIPHLAFMKAVEPPHQGIICEQNIEEVRRACNRKFPDKFPAFERFLAVALLIVELVPIPPSPHPDEDDIRDVTDRPILRAAIKAGADVLLTGDKDFLESAVTSPKIVSPAKFLSTI
jgi:putative PIN family toxin of toxin-antitoxin system